MNLDGYIRVSRTNGRKGKRFISPEVQRDAITNWARAHGHQIVKWHEELDAPAGAGKRRPIFDDMLARIERGDTRGVVLWKFSRFGRSQIEASLRIYKIEKIGAIVESATEGEQSKLTRTIMLAIAEDELDRLTESWRESQRLAVKRGVWIGRVPFGYRADDDGVLVVHEHEAQIVRRAFKLAARDGLHAAMSYLADAVPARTWRTVEARALLSQRAYLGEITYGDLHNPRAHEPLVTLAEFAAAQTEPRARASNSDYPLSKIAVCADCGEGMTGGLQTVGERSYRRMRCSECNRTSIREDGPGGLLQWAKDMLAIAISNGTLHAQFSNSEADAAADELRACEDEERRYARDVEYREIVSRDVWLEGARERAQRTVDARDKLQRASSSVERERAIPTVQQLDDPAVLASALARFVESITIGPGQRGRAVPVSDRVLDVRFVGQLDDDPARAELAA